MSIDSIVRHYIQDQKCDGALLINGKWGLGKSFYLREKLIPELQRHDSTLKFIYVSLNGISDPEQLSILIALEKWPFAKSKSFKIGTTIAGFLLDATAKLPGVDKAIGNQSLNKLGRIKIGEFLNFKNTVLCFDDFERNKIQPAILGFINTHFVETAKVKTILIGNEGEIDQSADYYRIKEKVIFRTVQFENAVSLETLAAHYQDDANFSSFILAHSAFLNARIQQFGMKNLRTLIFCLDIISRVHRGKTFGQTEALDQSILLLVLLIANEFKNGLLQSNDYSSFKGLDNLSSDAYQPLLTTIRARKTSPDTGSVAETTPSYEFVFYDKYALYNEPNFFFYRSLYSFVLSGDLNEDLLKEECKAFENILERNRLSEAPEKVALQIVQHPYWADSDEQLDDATAQFLGFIDDGKYLFYEYAHFFETLTGLINNGLWEETVENMKARVLAGCKTAINRSTIPTAYLDTLERNCRYSTDPDVNKLIRNEFARRQGIGEAESIDDYFLELQGPWHIFQSKYSTYQPFKIMDSKPFSDRFFVLNFQGLRNYNAILEQYNRTQNIRDFLGAYANQYADLKAYLSDNVREEKGGVRKLLINATIGELTKLEKAIS